jgi:Rieske Fe-S protein
MDMTRREALSAAAVAGVCAPLLAACGASSASGGTGAPTGATGGSGASSSAGNSGGATSGVTVKATDVPVGGGILADNSNVIVTQPKAGTYMAFQAVCPHQGSALPAPVNGTITCPLHGSTFGVDSSCPGTVRAHP